MHLNEFYQAKYSMFTCHDLTFNPGRTNYDTDLIRYWQKRERDQAYTWNLAVAYSLGQSNADLTNFTLYMKSFRQSKAFKSYLQKNPDHFYLLADIIEKVEHAQDAEWLEGMCQQIATRGHSEMEQVRKKVQFHKDKPGYIVPQELQKLIKMDEQQA